MVDDYSDGLGRIDGITAEYGIAIDCAQCADSDTVVEC
jgi:hypothetical protein